MTGADTGADTGSGGAGQADVSGTPHMETEAEAGAEATKTTETTEPTKATESTDTTDATETVTRVVIADDQALMRTAFRMILTAAGIAVVAEAATGLEAVDAVRRSRPDVVLMDIRMPELDGLEATARILAGPQPPRVIVVTTFDLDKYVYAALSAGASGFLLKDVTPEHLVAAVRMVRAGDAMLAPAITRRLVERFVGRDDPVTPLQRDLAVLTARELEVFRLLAGGLTSLEIAQRLYLSSATVKTHVARILSKLELRDRAQAIIVAYETGLITPGGGAAGRTQTPAS